MLDINQKIVTILGAQRSGQALARLVVRLGGCAKISEYNSDDSVSVDFKQWAAKHNVPLELGGHTQEFITRSDMIVLSPGVPLTSDAVQWATANSIPVLGEIEFAWQLCSKPVIAVTGSNGKTTVVTLIHKMLEASGRRSCLCGNVGMPFSDFVLDLDDKDYVVLEVSSFQMESIQTFRPFIGVLLNFSQNHLDRHADLKEYWEAKTRMFMNQTSEDHAVLNAQDTRCVPLADQLKAQVSLFNEEDKGINPNYQAVQTVAKILNIDAQVCQDVFSTFEGVEHRLERVRTLAGVEFINDSKATTAEAGRWALRNLHQPIIMLCGGRDKNIDFSSLQEDVRQKVKTMVVFGEAKEKLKQTFANIVDVKEEHSLGDAVEQARKSAQEGDCVVLSPMCASFDMFKDYEERGRVFKEIVNNLK